MLGLPISEWIRSSRESKAIEYQKSKHMRRLQNDMKYMSERNVILKKELEEVNKEIDRRIEEKKLKKLQVVWLRCYLEFYLI